MNIPSYIPIGAAKGFCKEKNEWMFGWHWVDTPYECFSSTSKIKHFIRVQHNYDWSLTAQEDFEVEPESVGFYIGRNDCNDIPLYLGDKISFEISYDGTNTVKYKGIIRFDLIENGYFINNEELGKVKFKDVYNILFDEDSYDKLSNSTTYTVNLQFRKGTDMDLTRIIDGENEYKEMFGKFPKEVVVTFSQFRNLMQDPNIKSINHLKCFLNKYGSNLIIKESEE